MTPRSKSDLAREQLEATKAAAEVFKKLRPNLDARGMGCIVIVANRSAHGALSYLSNIRREDAVTCIVELLDNLEELERGVVKKAIARVELAETLGRSESVFDVEQN